MTRKDKSILYLLIICVLLTLFKLKVQIDISSEGQELVQIRQQVKESDLQNEILKQKLYTLESLAHIQEVAQDEGFVPITKYYIVKGGDK